MKYELTYELTYRDDATCVYFTIQACSYKAIKTISDLLEMHGHEVSPITDLDGNVV